MSRRALAAFFFARESPRALALVRIALGLVLLLETAARWPFAIELYSSAGLPMPLFSASGIVPPVPGPAAAVALHSLLLFALAAVTVGWQTRPSVLSAVVLLGWFSLLDFPVTLTKYTAIALHLLVLLACSRCGSVWSVDARLAGRARQHCPLGTAWPRRLVQLLVCSVYWGAAVTKIRLPDFATGDLVEFALLSDRWGGTPLGLWLSTQSTLVLVASFATLALELFFPVLVWVRPLRRPMLVCAVTFHALLALTMNLGAFSFVMLAALLAFVRDDDLGELYPARAAREPHGSATRACARPARLLVSLSAYVALAAAAAVGGVLIQRSADWYRVFNVGRPEPLEILNRHAVDGVLAEQKPDYADLVHRFEIGSRMGYRRTFGTRTVPEEFRHGMTVHALARFVLNAETLALDWLLIAPQGQEAARHSHQLPAGTAYASVAFRMTPEAPPGRYRIILQMNGVAVRDRDFALAASTPGGDSHEDERHDQRATPALPR
jgi:Vitamin K-dependent gamma-carboxylase